MLLMLFVFAVISVATIFQLLQMLATDLSTLDPLLVIILRRAQGRQAKVNEAGMMKCTQCASCRQNKLAVDSNMKTLWCQKEEVLSSISRELKYTHHYQYLLIQAAIQILRNILKSDSHCFLKLQVRPYLRSYIDELSPIVLVSKHVLV